jgi:hypothetical protein
MSLIRRRLGDAPERGAGEGQAEDGPNPEGGRGEAELGTSAQGREASAMQARASGVLHHPTVGSQPVPDSPF